MAGRMGKKLILTASILMLFILGCNAGTSAKNKKEVDVRVGFSGLTIEYMKNTPPIKVFEDETFPVIIKIRNNGAYSISKDEKAVLSLGFEKDYTQKIQLLESGNVKKIDDAKPIGNAAAFNLEGKGIINPKGGEEIISYNVMAGKVDPQSETHASAIVAALCYPYQTELHSSICIDPDVSSVDLGKKACTVHDLAFNGGQGAPIAVTKIEASMLPAQIGQIGTESQSGKIVPQFLIFIENLGQGTVIRGEAVGKFCIESGISNSDLNIVNVQAFLSGKRLDCRKDKNEDITKTFVKLKDKKEMIRCKVQPEDASSIPNYAYSSPLKIILSYGYTNSISASYVIQKILR